MSACTQGRKPAVVKEKHTTLDEGYKRRGNGNGRSQEESKALWEGMDFVERGRAGDRGFHSFIFFLFSNLSLLVFVARRKGISTSPWRSKRIFEHLSFSILSGRSSPLKRKGSEHIAFFFLLLGKKKKTRGVYIRYKKRIVQTFHNSSTGSIWLSFPSLC